MLFTDRRGGKDFAKDPAVIRFHGKYYLYYTAWPTQEERERGISILVGMAESEDMESWQIRGILPLTQACEAKGIGAPAAIVLSDRVHLFYQTYGNRERDAICHAVSADGLHFEKDESNPVFRPTQEWCCGRAIDADVCVFNGKLLLYFATRDHDFRIQKIGAACADLNSRFTCGDWTQMVDQAVLSPEMMWEQECIEAPAAIVDRNRIYLFYGGAYNCMPQQIGCAVSEDGVFFRRVSNAPLLPHGATGSWNESESGHPYAFRDDDGKAYLFYQGSPDKGNSWHLSRARISFDGEKPTIDTKEVCLCNIRSIPTES